MSARSPSQQQVIGRAARQSYARQKLPMRVQSLAAYAHNSSVGRPPQQGTSYQRDIVSFVLRYSKLPSSQIRTY